MSVLPPEHDDDDAARLAKVTAELDRRTIAALGEAVWPGHRDAGLLRQLRQIDLHFISDEDRDLLRGLAWRWRRKLPRPLAPVLPPHDPIVREMGAAYA